MIYIVFLILTILLFRLIVLSKKNDTERLRLEKTFFHVVWIIIVLMAALRKPIVDTDVWGYMHDYFKVSIMSMRDVLEEGRFSDYIGYYFTSWLFSRTGWPIQAWFGFLEALYAYSMIKLINRYSYDKLFSVFVFITIGLFGFSLAGLKQVMSMSLMMLAFLKFVDKKYMLSILLAIYAYLCHPVGLIFLVAFLLYFIRNINNFIIYIVLAIGIISVSGMGFMSIMGPVIKNEHFVGYLEENRVYSYVTFIYYVVITAIAYLGYKSYNSNRPTEAKLIFGFSILACGLQFLARLSPNMFRLALYYTPFMMVLLPNATHYISGKTKQHVRFALIILMMFYYLYTSRNTAYPFSFFWQ